MASGSCTSELVSRMGTDPEKTAASLKVAVPATVNVAVAPSAAVGAAGPWRRKRGRSRPKSALCTRLFGLSGPDLDVVTLVPGRPRASCAWY